MRSVLARRLAVRPGRGLACRPAPTASRSNTSCRCQSTYNHFVGQDAPRTPEASSGFTLAVKDNIATADLPTQCASRILAGHQSPFEATIVRQLRERGAFVVGKTNMDEFGMGSHSTNSSHGPVRNPLSDDVAAGGSSGGSAVAVQLGDAEMAIGTDTGGSIRLPAAYTGTVGYKPSYGMISRFGVVPYANSLDTVGVIAKDAESIRSLVFDTGIHKENDPNDPTSLPTASRERCSAAVRRQPFDLSGLTIGIPLEYNIQELDPSIREAWDSAARTLQKQGAQVVPVSLPTTTEALCAYYVLAPAEASSNLAKYDGVRYGARSEERDGPGEPLYSRTRGAGFGDEVKRRILLGTYSLSSEAMDNYFIQAQKVRRLVQRDFDRVFRAENPLQDPRQFDLSDMAEATGMADKHGPVQVDFLLSPTAPTFPPKLSELRGQSSVDAFMNDVFTVPASLAGLPAVSIPAPVEGSVFPAGLQLIGQYWNDERMLVVAEKLQRLLSQK
ncbi:amidase signature domain-containing protein [Stachybotrys elegans]|uniref:Glutamyl-tRNA(Gln) amidotransferase subunit A, mitochondrial n=1 Tax=Stachybotrys elegans TaxID=80388 RepID=A0A8K0SPS9_9HYPO|nr:amidase signature domain-containing protein [Stachybotrys elegans]